MQKQAGAKAVIIFNNTKGSFAAGFEKEINLPAVTIPKKEGEPFGTCLRAKKAKPLHLCIETNKTS